MRTRSTPRFSVRRTRAWLAAVCASALSVTPSCSCVPAQGSCDGRPGTPVCSELLMNRHNQLRATFETLCAVGGGRYGDGLCDHTGALGGCLCEGCENGRSITWYFADADAGLRQAADVQAKCASLGRPYEAP